MTQLSRVTGVATTVTSDNKGTISVQYHQTVVAKRKGARVTLDTGGWRTATTRVRMNQFARQYCNGAYHVYQQRGKWFVELGQTQGYVDTLPFSRNRLSFTLPEGS